MAASDAVVFSLADGSSVMVFDHDLRRVYEALWDLAELPGAISTAAVLLHESNQSARFRHPVRLSAPQGDALKEALARFSANR